jgi:lactoylglutathione lyase
VLLKKVEHIGLEVADLDKSVKFYTEVLGMKLMSKEEMPDLKIAFLQIGNSQMEILCRTKTPEGYGKDGAFAHLAFTVDDIDAAVDRLRANDVTCTFDAPQTVLGGCRIFFFKGPDNETLELFQPRA